MEFILEILGRPDEEELLQGRLYLTSSTGNVVTDSGRITAFFDNSADRDAAARSFCDLDVKLESVERQDTDWLEHYQQSLEALFIGHSFIVAPDAALIPPNSDRHVLLIPQEQAFGTGSHETTSLCIEMLESIDLRGKRGLDVGSGSGILAIAMMLLGASKVIAFDNDADAFGPLRDNRMRNGVDCSLFIGSIEALRGGKFDVTTMNIVPEGIVALLPDVMARMDGELILSGILTDRRDDVVRAAAGGGATLRDESCNGEWWCGRFSGRRRETGP